QLHELRQRLGRRADVVDLDTRNAQSDESAGRRHPVVVVCGPGAAVQRSGGDPQTVGQLFDDATQRAQVADEGRDAVGLVQADVADAADRGRAVRERGKPHEGRRQLAGSGQIEVDTVDGGATAD